MSDEQRTKTEGTATPYQGTLDEHRECMQYVTALETCLDQKPDDSERWTGGLLEHLPGLARTMRTHFDAEEKGPLFTDLPRKRPTISARLESLKEEHPRLLSEVDRLIEIVSSSRQAELYELRELNARIQLFVARLRRHEATENELIFEAYWDDVGVGD